MSVAEMSSAIRQRVADIFKNEKISVGGIAGSRTKIFNSLKTTKALRSKFESAVSGHSSIVSKSGLEGLLIKIKDEIKDNTLKAQAESLIKNFDFSEFSNNWLPNHLAKGSSVQQIDGIKDTFHISNIPQSQLKEYFITYLESVLQLTGSVDSHVLIEYIENNIETGHLAGIFSYKFKVASGATVTLGSEKNYRDFTVSLSPKGEVNNEYAAYEKTIETALKLILDADLVSSGLVENMDIFVKATKQVLGDQPASFITELQFKKENQESGALLQEAGANLNKLIANISGGDVGANIYFKRLIISLAPVADFLIEKARALQEVPNTQAIANEMIGDANKIKNLGILFANTKGSPSIVKSLELNAKSLYETGKTAPKNVTTTRLKLNVKTRDPQSKDISKMTKTAALALNKAKQVIKSSKPDASAKARVRATRAVQGINLTSLQNFINTHLFEYIKKNMGDGNRRDILNFRTGRLAASAHVEGLSKSRKGAITAFYTYLKNPYATFSEGGKQQVPRTRDPKLLISKSVRELLAKKVSARLRAVVV